MRSIITRGQSRSRKREEYQPLSEINVTPFVDVVLVLLIIFIVTAPLLSVGVQVNLPETAAKPLPSTDEEPLTLTVTADGEVAIQSTTIERDELIPKLKLIMSERATSRIFIRGDGEAKYEHIMQVMGALNNAGYRDIGLVTDGGGPTLDEEIK